MAFENTDTNTYFTHACSSKHEIIIQKKILEFFRKKIDLYTLLPIFLLQIFCCCKFFVQIQTQGCKNFTTSLDI